MEEYSIITMYIPVSSREEAETIARYLLEKRYIGCANFYPMEGYYWWDKEIKHGHEFALYIKTLSSHVSIIEDEVTRMHSYDVPCIAKTTLHVNKEYYNWLKGELTTRT